ncbi:hypothetical protein llap_10415 [Limosa lapponica baueri]|uniref:Uncharacterized protein n=1 Tax=Limosa lapponica baueri TaxID=1758121 RepID=A0A2I0TZP5_LIMLA|nr:hypothetical protein llap_10415 [Limosa lapponica baueri]
MAELEALSSLAWAALDSHFGSRLMQARGAVDLACAALESPVSKLNSAFDFPVASATQLASPPPYWLFHTALEALLSIAYLVICHWLQSPK